MHNKIDFSCLSAIFNKEKEQKRLQQAQLVRDIPSQALEIYNTHEATRATRVSSVGQFPACVH